jgi:hypothetical protein
VVEQSGYVPLPPAARLLARFVADAYCFVPSERFCERAIARHVEPRAQVVDLYKKTMIIRKVLERQLLSVKNALLIKRQAEASADFTKAMGLMAAEIGKPKMAFAAVETAPEIAAAVQPFASAAGIFETAMVAGA